MNKILFKLNEVIDAFHVLKLYIHCNIISYVNYIYIVLFVSYAHLVEAQTSRELFEYSA